MLKDSTGNFITKWSCISVCVHVWCVISRFLPLHRHHKLFLKINSSANPVVARVTQLVLCGNNLKIIHFILRLFQISWKKYFLKEHDVFIYLVFLCNVSWEDPVIMVALKRQNSEWVILAAIIVCSMAFSSPIHPMIPHFSVLSLPVQFTPPPAHNSPPPRAKTGILKIDMKDLSLKEEKTPEVWNSRNSLLIYYLYSETQERGATIWLMLMQFSFAFLFMEWRPNLKWELFTVNKLLRC